MRRTTSTATTGIKAAVQAIDPDARSTSCPGVTGGTTGSQRCTTVDQASIAAAGGYDAVMVVAGTDSSTGDRGPRPHHARPAGRQASMISQVEAANPNTIVYLETIGQVDTSRVPGHHPGAAVELLQRRSSRARRWPTSCSAR